MRNSTQLDSLAALEEIAPRGVITSSETPVILSLRSADNDASHEDPAISKDKVEPRAQHSLAADGFGDVATTNTASSAWPMSYQLHQAASAHRSRILGQAIAAAIQTTVAIARRALARHRQRRRARVAYDALRQLDDRTLRDLGFDRSEITSVAAEVAGEAECTRVRALPNAIGSAAAVTNRITAWGDIEQVAARMPLAEGYRFEPLKRAQIGTLIGFIETWFPDISVGGASCYLRDQFYAEKVFFEGVLERDVLVVLLKHGDELAGMFSCERDLETLSVHARLGVAAPKHRGARLAQAGVRFIEEIGRRMGMGFVYGMATLKTPHAQRAFERAGWQLIGITPGYDREMVAPGVVKRVYEAVYAKVLVADDGLLRPRRQNLTPRTQALFNWMFADDRLNPSPTRELQGDA